MVRQSLDFHREMLDAIAALAATVPSGPVSRAVMARMLLGEALAARGINWTATHVPQNPARKREKKGAKK